MHSKSLLCEKPIFTKGGLETKFFFLLTENIIWRPKEQTGMLIMYSVFPFFFCVGHIPKVRNELILFGLRIQMSLCKCSCVHACVRVCTVPAGLRQVAKHGGGAPCRGTEMPDAAPYQNEQPPGGASHAGEGQPPPPFRSQLTHHFSKGERLITTRKHNINEKTWENINEKTHFFDNRIYFGDLVV